MLTGADHDIMLITFAQEDGQARVYVTRFSSVSTYFTECEGEGGIMLNIEPGLTTDPFMFERILPEIESSILEHIALLLAVPLQAVLYVSFSELRKLAVPELPQKYRYARSSKNRSVPRSY